MRIAEDVGIIIDRNHDSKSHDMDTSRIKAAPGVEWITALTKVYVQEIVKPDDPRFLNQYEWARCVVNERALYVQAYGLRNTSY